jgi:hypothetical protein
MPNVLIRDLPAEAHAVLSRRANDAGMSLQKFLVRALTRSALTPTMADVISGIRPSDLSHVGRDEIIDAIHEGRR